MFDNIKRVAREVGGALSTINNITRVSASFVLTFMQSAANLAAPYLLVSALNDLSAEEEQGSDENSLLPLVKMGGFIALWITGQAMPYLREMALQKSGADLSLQLTHKVMQQSYDLPMAMRISNTNAPAVQHFGSAYEHIGQTFVTTLIGSCISSVIEVMLTAGAISIAFDPGISIPAWLLLALYVPGAVVSGRSVGNAQNQYIMSLFNGYEFIIGQLDNYENAHYYGNVRAELDRLDSNMKRLGTDYVRSLSVRSKSSTLLTALTGIGSAAIIIYASALLRAGRISSNDLIILTFYAMQEASALRIFSESLTRLCGNYESFRALLEYLHDQPSRGKESLYIRENNASIEFRNVSFSYEGKQILRRLSFKIEPGQTVAIVGKSGSGKSTILRLLYKFYEPTSGEVLIAQKRIDTIAPENVRNCFAVVPQAPIVFPDTLFQNILYGNLNASREEVIEAARRAGLDDVLIDGRLDEAAGSGGARFSGGQRQRIGVARAYLKSQSASFIALDEATSALDERTEEGVLQALNELVTSQRKTTIIITHNLERLRRHVRVDQVIDLDRQSAVALDDVPSVAVRSEFVDSPWRTGVAPRADVLASDSKQPLLQQGVTAYGTINSDI